MSDQKHKKENEDKKIQEKEAAETQWCSSRNEGENLEQNDRDYTEKNVKHNERELDERREKIWTVSRGKRRKGTRKREK